MLWTLYAGFAYLLYSIILLLVVGWRKWGIVEYGAIGAGPVVYASLFLPDKIRSNAAKVFTLSA